MVKNRILVLYAHPISHKSKINSKLISGITGLEGVLIHNLYEMYPDFYIDVRKEQNLLIEHDIIIWQHPFYWYSAPSILKEWIDLVLEHNFAYGKNGNALVDKYVLTAITAGGSKEAYETDGYNNFSIRQFLTPYQQTVQLCKMHYLPPFVVHGTHFLKEKDIQEYTKDYKKIVIALRDNLFDLEELLNYEYLNDLVTN